MVKNTLDVSKAPAFRSIRQGKKKADEKNKHSLSLLLPFRREEMLDNLELFHFIIFCCFSQMHLEFQLLKKGGRQGKMSSSSYFINPANVSHISISATLCFFSHC